MSTENENTTTTTVQEPKPGTKDALKAENDALKAELEALKAAVANTAPEAPKAEPKLVKIRLPKTKADQEDVPVWVNNKSWIIKRGVEVEVPASVAEVLRHKEEMMEQIMLFEDANANK